MSELEYVYGIHACDRLIQNASKRVVKAFLLDSRSDQLLENLRDQLSQNNIEQQSASRDELDELAHSEQHQGIVLACKPAQIQDKNYLNKLLDELNEPAFLVVLDSVTDPHNVGACLRSAEAAGAHALIVPKNRACGLTPAVRKVACGAAEVLPMIVVNNLSQCFRDLKNKGVWIYGAAGEASQSIFQTDLTDSLAIVMGSEGKGLRKLSREHCDVLVNIPMQGTMQSLNVSVAAGVCAFEVLRQRQAKA